MTPDYPRTASLTASAPAAPDAARRRPYRGFRRWPVDMLTGCLRWGGAAQSALWPRLQGQRHRGALQTRLDSIRLRRSAIGQYLATIEAAFLQAGASLEKQNQLATGLVEQGNRLRGFTAAEKNPVREAIRVVQRGLSDLDQFRTRSGEMIAALQRQQTQVTGLLQHASHLDRAFAPLRIVETLFRIEAATLPVEMQAAFAALTHEIAGLDSRVRSAFSRHFDALAGTAKVIDAVMGELRARGQRHEHTIATDRQAIATALSQLDADITRLAGSAQRLAEAVASIEQEGNGLITGLQYQDITRQKLEHVSTALDGLSERAASDPSGAVTFIRQTAKLQAAQLAAVETEVEETLGAMRGGLSSLLERLQRLEVEWARATRQDATAESVDRTIRSLDRMLTQVAGAMREVTEGAAAVARAVGSGGGLTADLGDTIRELTWGIRLIALNAQVQAAQVARCDGLEVLARHTYLVSEETSAIAETLGQELDQVAGQLRALVADADAFAAEAGSCDDRLQAETQSTREALEAQRVAVDGALTALPELVSKARGHAERLSSHLGTRQIDHVAVTELRAELEQLADWCASIRPSARGQETEPFDNLQRMYTMASEREVHAAVLCGQGPASAHDQEASATGNAVEFFDSIETSLSRGSSREADSEALAELESHPNGAEPVTREESVTSVGAPVEAPAGSETDREMLGANVELF